ncbi:MAG: acyltransferase [Candidatus Acidiferrum sp.]
MKISGRIPELDGLRGIAIAMVLLYHYFQQTLVARPGSIAAHMQSALGLGWSGVDLFFVLSGFLIGGILLDAKASTNFFQVFYRRRFFRIVPLYAAILILFPALAHLAQRANLGDFSWLIAGKPLPWYSYLTFTQNFWMAHGERFGAMTLAVTWSLAVEEQFYLTLPILVRKLTAPQLMKCVRRGIYMAPLLRIVLGLLFPHNWIALFALAPCRADSLLLGVLAAMLIRDSQWRERMQRNHSSVVALLAILFLGVVALSIWAPEVYYPVTQTVGYTWLALFYASVLLYAVTSPTSTLSRALRIKWLGWLGGIAYGTYLIHEMVQGMFFGIIWHGEPAITDGWTFLTTVAALIVTLAIAQFSWKYFESPLMKGHRTTYQFAEEANDELLTVPPAH